MTRAWWVLTATLALGCTAGPFDTGDTGDTGDTASSGCPSGMTVPRSAGIFFDYFYLDGLQYSPVYSDGTYMGRPSACMSSDGHSVDYLFLLESQPYGRIAMSAPTSDTSYDLNGTQAQIEIEVFGASNQPTFANGEFQTGSWYVTSVGSTFDSDVDGSALDDTTSSSLGITFTIQGTR